MSDAPLMPKATAVWLVENTSLTFDQIAEFCKLHPLEVKGIADGEVATGIKGYDPISTGQLTREEIAAAEQDPDHRLHLSTSKVRTPEFKKARGALSLSLPNTEFTSTRSSAGLGLGVGTPNTSSWLAGAEVGRAVVISADTSVWLRSSSTLGRSLAARLTSKSRSICEHRPSVTGSIG